MNTQCLAAAMASATASKYSAPGEWNRTRTLERQGKVAVGNAGWSATGKRARTVVCSSAEGGVVDDSYCADPTASPGEIWKPASSTTSRPMLGAIALIDRGLCAFISKAQMVELSSAIAAVVVDTQDRGKEYSGLNRPSADARQVGIPLIFLSKVPGERLKSRPSSLTRSYASRSTRTCGSPKVRCASAQATEP